VRIILEVSPRGLLRRFEADGHAGEKARGGNIACAALTTLLRTTGRLCAERGLMQAGAAEKPGEMSLIVRPGAADDAWLKGVTDFLLQGVQDLQAEFSKEITLRVETTEV
jgi:uncharacterized protein YsxB (DUF464 family)